MPKNMLYIMDYVSPKGVCLEHAYVVDYVIYIPFSNMLKPNIVFGGYILKCIFAFAKDE